MAIPSDPDCQRIASEFMSNTRNQLNGSTNVALYNLKNMYNHVIDSNPHSRFPFAGKGRPTGNTNGVSNVTANSVTFHGTVDYNFAFNDRGFRFIYGTDEFNLSSATGFSTASGSVSLSASGLQSSTTYYFKIQFYNSFNSHSSDYMERPLLAESFNTASACSNPTGCDFIYLLGINVNVGWTAPSDGSAGSYEVWRRINSGTWTVLGTTTNTSFSDSNYCNFVSNSDTLTYRVRSKCGTDFSGFSTSLSRGVTGCGGSFF